MRSTMLLFIKLPSVEFSFEFFKTHFGESQVHCAVLTGDFVQE